jgi:hypothetical protein
MFRPEVLGRFPEVLGELSDVIDVGLLCIRRVVADPEIGGHLSA